MDSQEARSSTDLKVKMNKKNTEVLEVIPDTKKDNAPPIVSRRSPSIG